MHDTVNIDYQIVTAARVVYLVIMNIWDVSAKQLSPLGKLPEICFEITVA